MSIKSWAKTKIGGRRLNSFPKCGIDTTAVTQKRTTKIYRHCLQSKITPPPFFLRQAAKTYVATPHSVVRQETIETSLQRTAFVWFFAQEVDIMSKKMGQTALADHCINKPLKKLRWSYGRLIWRKNSFDMYHWALGCSRSEKIHFDHEFENYGGSLFYNGVAA